ncbi:MAG: transposase [Nitrososphaerota archaeon]|jgi:putative transposase|nr:transposase [Nitrososphaerota archaeon]MDG6936549.1 transposase [Nitrososphaerota archaeon]MDG6944202.1 transposase [Nitrososphaerota archaeon]
MSVRCYEVKVAKNHIDADTLERLDGVFLEAKWLVNYAIASGPFATDYKIKSVQVKVGDSFEERQLKVISSQMKQALIEQLKQDIRNLNIQKNSGKKVGGLKFRKSVNTIPLKQEGFTYKIIDKRHISVQRIGALKVNGLDQIPENAELANARLIKRHDDYYIQITTFMPKEEPEQLPYYIGIDFGIRNQLTLSNGVRVNFKVPVVNEKVKRLQRALARKKRGSKRYRETQLKLQKEYERLADTGKDIANKIGSYLVNNFALVSYQNDNIRWWEKLWGRIVGATSLGNVKVFLGEHGAQEIDRFYPSTQECSLCHKRTRIPLSQRVYECPYCGNVMDRDLNSAIDNAGMGLTVRKTMGFTEPLMPADDRTSTSMVEYFKNIPFVVASLVNETGRGAL